MMKSKPRYYLDTSSIRSAGSKLGYCRGYSLFTSSWTVIELINGIRSDDKSFQKRSRSLKQLKNQRIVIDWDTLSDKFYSNFTYCAKLKFDSEISNNLQSLYKLVYRSDDIDNFRKSLGNILLTYNIDYFEDFDTDLGSSYVQNSIQSNIDIRSSLEREKMKADSLIPAEILNGNIQDFLQWIYSNPNFNFFSLMAYADSKAIIGLLNEYYSAELHEKIWQSYNNNNAIYTKAWFSYFSRELSKMNQPGRNDFADLYHFQYLKNDDILVTEDKKMKEIAQEIDITVKSINDLIVMP
jgi:hypothetical protein